MHIPVGHPGFLNDQNRWLIFAHTCRPDLLKHFTSICITLLITTLVTASYAQEPNPPSKVRLAPNALQPDTILMDSLHMDSLPQLGKDVQTPIVVAISPDSLDAKVEYGSADSNYLDNQTHKVFLFGDAYVLYKDLSLKADFIVVDLDSSIATAEGMIDSLGKLAGIPQFQMGDESFSAEKMRYNFRERKGIIYNAVTKEGELIIHGEKTKFVAGGGRSEHEDDILYGEGALITTCDAPVPHFGIRATKVKTIPDKLAVIGPSNLELFGVPTPLILPFGFYPVSETRTAGVILPRDYERSPELGFGLRGLGYYFPLGESMDFRILGDIYFNGTWGIGVNTNYLRKYKYRGNADIRYSYRITEPANDYRENIEKSFSVRLTHNQDPKSNPYQTLGGSIQMQSNDFESLNYNDAQSVLNNTYSSSFNYSRIFPGKPYSLSLGMQHSQNTRSHVMTINAPELNFRLNRIYPFKSEKRPGPDLWYEKIAFLYAGSGRGQLIATDTTLFDPVTWENAQYGAQHRANVSMNFNAAKWFNFTTAVDYGETWFFKTRDNEFDFDANDTTFVKDVIIYTPDGMDSVIVKDTVSYGVVNANLVNMFEAFRTMNASISMNTQLFGVKDFKKGWLRGIRHVLKPSFGFSFSPSSPSSYYEYEEFSILYPDSMKRFSKFDNLLYSVRPTDIPQANFNYSFNNIFEAKYFTKRDSTIRKLKLFDNIAVGGSYNMAADSFRFSPLNISGNTRFFKNITTFSVGATYSYYGRRQNGSLSPELYINSHNKLLRFESLRLRFSSRISYDDILGLFRNEQEEDVGRAPAKGNFGTKPGLDTRSRFEDLLSRFVINHELGITRMWQEGPDTTFITTNSINMVGSMQLTPGWSVHFGNIGYDFKTKQLTYPDIGLTRDLHCWEIGFTFQPDRGTYAFHIGVKPGTFDFLRMNYKRGNYDTSGGF